jgi:hypothetical protein
MAAVIDAPLPPSLHFRLRCATARQDGATRQCKKAGFIGIRRKPLILPVLASLCRFLPVFANKKKILWTIC